MILAEITVDNTVYYLSQEGYQGEYFYYPFLISMPRLDIGAVGKGGLIGVRLGDLTITNDPHNQQHPFSGTRYADLLAQPYQYSCRIYWSETMTLLHDGAISLAQIEQTQLTFTLADPAFEQILKYYSITNKWFYVEEVLNTTPVTITVSGHEFVVGQEIVFDLMQGPGQELNYDRANHNYYVVASVSGNTIGLKDSENQDILPANVTLGTVTLDNGTTDNIPKNRVGIPALVPFTHGAVFHKTPVIRRHGTEVANPNMSWTNTEFPLEVYEDGVLIGSTDPASPELFNRAPTETVIYLNSQMAEGDLSISGISLNGSTISDLFIYLGEQLNLGYNGDKA